MDSGKKITLVNNLEQVEEVELVCSFEEKETKSKYLIYTKNEKDKNGSIIIYLGKLKEEKDRQHLVAINSSNEWNMLKEIVKKMITYTNMGDKI